MTSIFIAEDEDELRFLFKELLESRGFDVFCNTCDCKDTLKSIKNLEENPNLYILDHALMLTNDIETYRKIMKRDPYARILFMSEDEKLKNKIKGNGNVGVLVKPFLLSTFMDAVQKMVFGPTPAGSGSTDAAVFRN